MTTAAGPAAGPELASHAPLVATNRAELADALAATRAAGGRVALVPTMGALHVGHAALIDLARESAEAVVVSVFVNPLQFAPGEDLERYPRTFAADLELCGGHGADIVFAPAVDEVYPGGEPQVTVEPGPLGTRLEGASRPTHFRGVLTVVAKLFGLVRPDLAFFGQKDYQQLVLIGRMVADLCLQVDVVGVETVREPDGLALSSRNAYLDAPDRSAAVALSQALRSGAQAGAAGAGAVLAAATDVLQAEPGIDLDYLELTSPELGPTPPDGEARLLVAARVGSTRLIDNIALVLGTGDPTRPTGSS